MNLDFTSSLYLGLLHEHQSLTPWSQLTSGLPAVLGEAPGSETVASRLAGLQSCDQAVLAKSTLHLFWDLFGVLSEERVAIFQDEDIYSIAQWGIERAAARGVPVYRFPHKDVRRLESLLQRRPDGRRPIIVSDGICTACGCAMPIKAYNEAAQRAGGLLVIDDTQALGLLGVQPGPAAPYGRGGGGSLRYQNLSGTDVVVVSSLAKGFGVPLAVLSGSVERIRQFKLRSQTRIHCSPPSAADIHAAARALDLNARHGDRLRRGLAQRIQQFRRRLSEAGVSVEGGLFPIQSLRLPADRDPKQVYQDLLDLGIRTLLRTGCSGGRCLSMIITVRHQEADFEYLARALEGIMKIRSYLALEPG